MAPGAATEVNGINLENYFPSRRSYNSVAFIHKKFFNNSSVDVPNVAENVDTTQPMNKERKKKTKNISSNHKYHNKTTKIDRDFEQTSINNDEVLGQTIRFAKNIVPIVIPPSNNDTSPVYYTIKTSRRSRVRNSIQPRNSTATQEKDTLTYKKEQERKIIETFRKHKLRSHTESCSQESTSRSSIENIVISQSLNSTISDISEKMVRKTRHRDKSNKTQIVASESLEALATELLHATGEAKIKIHLMDDTAKDLFYESIRKPVIEAIKESIAEMVHSKENSESKIVHRYVQCHSQKLDNIIDKLTCIEKRLESTQEKAKPRKVKGKPSALEEIGEDISEEKDDFENDVAVVYSAAEIQKNRLSSAAARLNPLQKIDEVSSCSGDGDEIITHKGIAPILSERPNKIPARYCWTDSTNQ